MNVANIAYFGTYAEADKDELTERLTTQIATMFKSAHATFTSLVIMTDNTKNGLCELVVPIIDLFRPLPPHDEIPFTMCTNMYYIINDKQNKDGVKLRYADTIHKIKSSKTTEESKWRRYKYMLDRADVSYFHETSKPMAKKVKDYMRTTNRSAIEIKTREQFDKQKEALLTSFTNQMNKSKPDK